MFISSFAFPPASFSDCDGSGFGIGSGAACKLLRARELQVRFPVDALAADDSAAPEADCIQLSHFWSFIVGFAATILFNFILNVQLCRLHSGRKKEGKLWSLALDGANEADCYEKWFRLTGKCGPRNISRDNVPQHSRSVAAAALNTQTAGFRCFRLRVPSTIFQHETVYKFRRNKN